jgi:hypothetical protein
LLEPNHRVEFDVNGAELVFGNLPATGAISGLVWNDQDADGILDPGEDFLGGADIRIDEVVNGEIISTRTVTTAADGTYRVAGLVPNSWNGGQFGEYIVRQIAPPEGYTQVFPVNPSFYSIDLEAGEEVFNVNFGDQLNSTATARWTSASRACRAWWSLSISTMTSLPSLASRRP